MRILKNAGVLPPEVEALRDLDGLLTAGDEAGDARRARRSGNGPASGDAAGKHPTVNDPTEAVACIEKIKPQVLVVDLGMPAIDGFELIGRIRAAANPDVSDVPAVALTAFARSEDRTRALRAGFEMHLAKPVDPGELVQSVASLARRARLRS